MSYITVLHIPSLRNGRQLHAKVAHQVDRWAALRPTRTFLTGLPDVECPCANHPSPPHPPGSALTWGGLGTPSIRRCFTSDPVTEISDEGARNRPARLTNTAKAWKDEGSGIPLSKPTSLSPVDGAVCSVTQAATQVFLWYTNQHSYIRRTLLSSFSPLWCPFMIPEASFTWACAFIITFDWLITTLHNFTTAVLLPVVRMQSCAAHHGETFQSLFFYFDSHKSLLLQLRPQSKTARVPRGSGDSDQIYRTIIFNIPMESVSVLRTHQSDAREIRTEDRKVRQAFHIVATGNRISRPFTSLPTPMPFLLSLDQAHFRLTDLDRHNPRLTRSVLLPPTCDSPSCGNKCDCGLSANQNTSLSHLSLHSPTHS
ncbi:unnamed protein product [Mesocestoides corti]|uniref:Uncharacterized protein n=1 Tax=Mesocestoides corti TaxID=53468 RepID=A0A0R3UQG6_MESCO|nr:unnamed protein product [Mesocestoides corti]